MNCFYHPSRPAVAQCADCGKGLCLGCATKYAIPICNSCNQKRGRKSAVGSIKPLLICAVLFIIGYNLDIMGSDRLLGGYMFMSIYAGWKFIDQFIPNVFIWFNLQVIFWYYLIRIGISMFVGVFVTPFYLVWCLYRIFTN